MDSHRIRTCFDRRASDLGVADEAVCGVQDLGQLRCPAPQNRLKQAARQARFARVDQQRLRVELLNKTRWRLQDRWHDLKCGVGMSGGRCAALGRRKNG